MRKVHVLKREKVLGLYVASTICEMPELKKGWIGKRVQGGHAPVPFRQHSNNLGRASVCARVPQQNVWAD
jgi:hypothetical protein